MSSGFSDGSVCQTKMYLRLVSGYCYKNQNSGLSHNQLQDCHDPNQDQKSHAFLICS